MEWRPVLQKGILSLTFALKAAIIKLDGKDERTHLMDFSLSHV